MRKNKGVERLDSDVELFFVRCPIFGILFYLLVVLAAITSSISLLEVIVTHFVDVAKEKGKGDKRKTYSVVATILIAALCVLVCLDGLGSNGLWVPFQKTLGVHNFNDCWLDFFDMISEGILMPLGALLMCLMIGWEIGPKTVEDECNIEGNVLKSSGMFNICVKVVTPVLMLLILGGQIYNFFLAH